MGTWGHGSFDNDGANDWLDELHGMGLSAIRGTLGRVARAKADIDVDEAQAAIAAAEVVAAARGNPRPGRQPDLLAVWVDEHRGDIEAKHAELAANAVTRVRDSSELQELWQGDPKWTRDITKLLGRLAAKPKRPRAAVRSTRARRAVEPPKATSVPSPNRALTATVVGNSARSCYVMIEARDGGGSVFAAACRHDMVAIGWLDNKTLEIRYPKTARVDQRDPTWQLMRRRVACRYRAVAPRKPST